MSFYSQIIFPRIVNLVLSDRETTRLRREVLAGVSGEVLELGFGTGLNLPHYPAHVERLTTVDPNPGMAKAARAQIEKSRIEVDMRLFGGEMLPFEDASFDTIVCTWTLCSVRDVDRVLAQCHRVLRPGGRFLFVEHGLADSARVRRWQERLEPLWGVFSDGCHLNRDIGGLIGDSKFRLEQINNFYMPHAFRFAGYMYQGVAVKAIDR